MMDATKYAPGYYPVPAGYDSWVKKDHIEKAPAWCSVDLRDGNQALIVPMSLEEKLEFFQMLVKIGFKEIEVGFPAASETEYEFLRTLIEKNMIPEDVTVQVLTQCRDHIFRRTFEAVKGAPRAVIHFYNSTSVAQREQVFHKSKEEIKKIATDGAKLVKQLSQEYEGNFLFEYSPESFTGTEVDYAVDVCNAVLDIMQPTPDRPMIINLPVTVEMSMPHVYANQIEYCDKHLKYRDSVIISTHPHNDRGTGVACAELAVLAGAAALALRQVRDFAKKGAACILLCGVLFAFANPPMQTPDETDHYLRTYAISMGRFDFDAQRGYPEDVDELVAAFPGAWVNAHTSAGLGTDPDTHAEQPFNSAGYALKQYGKDGRVESIRDSFEQYLTWLYRDSVPQRVTEPVSFLILPFLPGALGMALARLFGLGALGCLYGGRLVNLLAHTALCYAALRSAHKCRPAFLCIMLMPMSLYMGASLSYDATLLGCYYLMLALLTWDEWNDKTALFYALACVFANGTKPYINLLWVVLPLILRKSEWKVRFSRAVYAVLTAAGALALTLGVEQYGTLLRHNYGAIARQGGTTVNGGAQLLFVLKNPLRYIAVLLGTLYENDGFLGQLGLFGWKDMPIAFISITAPPVLLAAAMLCTAQTDTLGRRRMGWLGVFGLVYAVGAMTAMYITYTPVGMVRIVGLQTRYFLPVWLLLVLAAAAVLRRVLAPRLTAAKGEALAVTLCGWYAFAGAVLLFQHYFVGPVYTIYK